MEWGGRDMKDKSSLEIDSVCKTALLGGAKVKAWFCRMSWKNFFAVSAE
jgi:hypothetical protein